MKHAFITGITGFLGGAVARELMSDGYAITALVRDPKRLNPEFKKIEIIEGDLDNHERLADLLEDALHEETEVYHIAAVLGAAQASKKTYQRVNVDATEVILKKAIEKKVKKFIFVSSMGAAGPIGSLENPITEDMEGKPIAYYSRSKLQAERLIMERAPEWLPVIILRPPNIFGPKMNPKSGATMVFKGCKRKLFAIIGKGRNRVNFAYIDNVVEGVLSCTQAVEKGHEIFFISDESSYVMLDLLDEIKDQLNSDPLVLKIPGIIIYPLALLAEGIGKLFRRDIAFNRELVKGMTSNAYVFSIEKAKKFGFRPKIDMKTGVQKTLEYLAEY